MQTFIKWTSGTICCEGYKHDSDLDACKPICSTGCLNGHCTGPETCNCNPPLYLDPIRKNVCLSPPVCNPSCVNAKCVIKEENFSNVERRGFCECLVNTRRYNDSHCAYCQEGFKINPDLSCMPICKTPCNNGECIAPNKCKCSEGYRAKNDLICEPHCEFCVNSDCVEPNKCKCHPGFSIVNNTHCEQCDCENGDCVLGQCVCHDGYILNEGVCEPVCDKPCVNSVCVAPSMCACFEGHRKSNVSRVCCRPECGGVCNADGECPTVACVPR